MNKMRSDLKKMQSNWCRGESYILPHWGAGLPKFRRIIFPNETLITITYRTDRDALLALLPPGLEPLGDPTLCFRFRYGTGMDWATGGVQPLIGVFTPVRTSGAHEIEGVHWPVLWEVDPIMMALGREVMGVSKLCAQISTEPGVNGRWRAVASEHGLPMIEIRFNKGQEISGGELSKMQERGKKTAVIGYRYMPSVDANTVEMGYLTHFPQQFFIEKAWHGDGTVKFHNTSPETHVWSHHVIEKLARIPLKELLSSTMSVGNGVIHMDEGKRIP